MSAHPTKQRLRHSLPIRCCGGSSADNRFTLKRATRRDARQIRYGRGEPQSPVNVEAQQASKPSANEAGSALYVIGPRRTRIAECTSHKAGERKTFARPILSTQRTRALIWGTS